MKNIIVALLLLQFHTPTGQRIDVNPDKISSLREPSTFATGHWAKGVHCIIVMGANRVVAIREDCDEARQEVRGRSGPCALVCGEAPKR